MPKSDAFVVGDDFLSEHFFTSDANKESFFGEVTKLRSVWDKAEYETPRSRFTRQRGALASEFSDLYQDFAPSQVLAGSVCLQRTLAVYKHLLEVLGYTTGEFVTHQSGPVTWINTAGVSEAAPLAIVQAGPADNVEAIFSSGKGSGKGKHKSVGADTVDEYLRLTEPWMLDEKTMEVHATSALSRLFNSEDAPEFVLLLAGRFAVLTQQSRWAEGRYLAVDVQTVCERNETKKGGEIDRLLACLSADCLAPDAEGQVWWSHILEASVKHTVGVSKDLREGVRRSIEIIANEVVDRRKLQGLEPLQQQDAEQLTRQSLRFLYRILFLLYAEASPELGVLPVGAPEYDNGYSLDRLRELTLVELTGYQQQQGTHLYDSLAVLFNLVDQGHLPAQESTEGLSFHSLRADLFRPDAISLISQTKLGNGRLQDVLRRLLLSKETKGKERGFISYVDLGINQLGAVYEGLMSYTGFFATEDLYEVARGGDAEKGSWVVPSDRIQDLNEQDFVYETNPETGERQPVVHSRGEFVFRLSGRARQQSASYYTPEVLTRFTVSQALEELLDGEQTSLSAEEILGLSICEPALGSGAFAIEAVQQLAERYLQQRQEELGEQIEPENYQAELQKVKAYLALHNVYGVDLNATAVEFAEITLWLSTMARGLAAPWFGLHLRRGNSLIGARHACYSQDAVNDKNWLKEPARDLPLTDLAARIDAEDHDQPVAPGKASGQIYHFLLPAAGWGATSESKEAKNLAPEQVQALKAWRKSFNKKLTKSQVRELVQISAQVEELWTLALRRLTVAEKQSRRSIDLWGRAQSEPKSVVTREQIEESLADPEGAFQRLKRVMDAWCALWFWPVTESQIAPPSLEQWIAALKSLLGTPPKVQARDARLGQESLAASDLWEALAAQEQWNLTLAKAEPVETVLSRPENAWLHVCERVAAAQGFFHWELFFAPVFARGGFDLQVGNPPWVRPRGDAAALLAEGDPWWQLTAKPSVADAELHREKALAVPGVEQQLLEGDSEIVATAAYVGDITTYPFLTGLQPDLYRCFMSTTWAHGSRRGTIGLIHPDTHLTDEKAGALREETYPRLRRHWQFVNELQLFSEIHHLVSYGVHVYSTRQNTVRFRNASALYHPNTVTGSLRHDGSGAAPGFKYEGHWDLRPHAQRIQLVDDEVLKSWRDILDPELIQFRQTRMVYSVNQEVAATLEKLSSGRRLGDVDLQFSRGWDESIDRDKGRFIQEWGAPGTWNEVILQGPHMHVGTPLFKQPNPTMKHNQDWSATDFETLPSDAIPITSYKPAGDRSIYDAAYTHWKNAEGDQVSARDSYRVSARAMAANTGERTLISAIFPPGTAHINGVLSIGSETQEDLLRIQSTTSTLLTDFALRSAPKSAVLPSIPRLPLLEESALDRELFLRTLRLNCVTDAYADLWQECWNPQFAQDSWTIPGRMSTPLGIVGPVWDANTPLRRAVDRRQALVEIDALAALILGISIDELCTVYRTQFAVLYGYDHDQYTYDVNGRLVPNEVLKIWREHADSTSVEDRTHTNEVGNTYTYELPFTLYDREADMRTAYQNFAARLQERS